jgi:hypothetical protein
MSQPRGDKLAIPSLLPTADRAETDDKAEALTDTDLASEFESTEWPMSRTGGARGHWRFVQVRNDYREPADLVFNQIRGLRKVPGSEH